MTTRKLTIVHVCDHLGWAGSRMHGVKRLFAWMMPLFDPARFNASLVSLRRKDLSDDTLEQFGIDVTYLGRHKFDPATFTHLLKVLQEKHADVVFALHDGGGTIQTTARITGKAASMGEGVVQGVLAALIADFAGKLGQL